MKSLAKKISLIVVSTVLIVLLVVGGFFAAMMHHFHPSAPRLQFAKANNALAAQRQDIRYFRQLLALDRSFDPSARVEAYKRLAVLEASDAVLDPPHFQVALMQIDALTDNGHSKVESDWNSRPMELPVRVTAFSDGLYIMRSTDINTDLLGGRVVSIDGQPVNLVMAKLEQLRGGTPQWRRLYASQYITYQNLLYGIDVAKDTRHSNWTVESPSGKTITRTLDSYIPSGSEPRLFVKRWLSSEPLAGLESGWRAYEPDRGLPLSLTQFDKTFRSLPISGTCLRFVQFKSNADDGNQHIQDFITDTEQQLQMSRPCGVILDLRYDDGGDFLNTYRFARDLPKLIPAPGKIFMLTGSSTFSAGISTAAFVKNAGGDRVVILGELVGDRLQFFSEGGRACLPNHPLCVSYETGKHDYQHACGDWQICFWLDYFLDSRVTTLDPDEVIPLSFRDWRTGVDPVLDRAVDLANATINR